MFAGPALIGFVAHTTTLNLAFAGLECLMFLVAASSRLGMTSLKNHAESIPQ